MPTEERFSNLYKVLSSKAGTNPAAYSYADANGAVLYIQSTVTGYVEEFPAFLTDLSQNFTSNWSTEDVYGRNDPIATFQGTKRTISLAFDLPAGSLQDAKDNLDRCSNLTQMMYPGYHRTTKVREVVARQSPTPDFPQAGGQFEGVPQEEFGALVDETAATGLVLGRSPLVKVKFGNLIVAIDGEGLLGWIGSLSWKPNLEMGMFTESQGKFYPKVISLSFDLNVLHQTNVGQNKDKKKETINGWLSDNQQWPFGKK